MDITHQRISRVVYTLHLEEPFLVTPDMAEVGQFGEFRYELGTRALTVFPLVDFPTLEAACNVLDPLLLAWVTEYALRARRRAFRFEFQSHQIEDVRTRSCQLQQAKIALTAGKFGVGITIRPFPRPSSAFVVDELTEDLSEIALASNRSPSHALKDGYAAFTRVIYEYLPVSRNRAAARVLAERDLGLDRSFLNRMQKLSTQRSSGSHSRKWETIDPPPPINDLERAWLLGALLVLARRAGQRAAGQSDLPPLKPQDVVC